MVKCSLQTWSVCQQTLICSSLHQFPNNPKEGPCIICWRICGHRGILRWKGVKEIKIKFIHSKENSKSSFGRGKRKKIGEDFVTARST